jgi:cell division protease FtsH
MINRIIVAMGGRAAEKIVFGDITQGAQGDIKSATQIARDMITKYGMSEKVGPIALGEENEVFIGRDYGHTRNYSEEVASLIDEEIKKMINDGYNKAIELLKGSMDKLKEISEVLLDKEKIDEEEFNAIFDGTYKKEEPQDSKEVAQNAEKTDEGSK